MPTSTVEDYLKAILRLSQDQPDERPVSVGSIAAHLEVTPGTVTTMMNHLSNQGLVNYTPRRGVALNAQGETAALQVLRRHRLIELFLVEVMKLDWAHVHEEAEILEHAVSDRLVERMDEMLGHPSHDPHGDPIPDATGKVPDHDVAPLADSPPGAYQLIQVSQHDPQFLTWLQEQGMQPGAKFELTERETHAGILCLRLDASGETLRLGDAAAKTLLVIPA